MTGGSLNVQRGMDEFKPLFRDRQIDLVTRPFDVRVVACGSEIDVSVRRRGPVGATIERTSVESPLKLAVVKNVVRRALTIVLFGSFL